MKRTVNATSDSVVCTLAEDELRDRARALRSGVFAAITAARETHDGFELAFPSGCGDMLCDFVAVESRCCSFVTFTIDDRDGQTWLGLSGPEHQGVCPWLDPHAGSGRWASSRSKRRFPK